MLLSAIWVHLQQVTNKSIPVASWHTVPTPSSGPLILAAGTPTDQRIPIPSGWLFHGHQQLLRGYKYRHKCVPSAIWFSATRRWALPAWRNFPVGPAPKIAGLCSYTATGSQPELRYCQIPSDAARPRERNYPSKSSQTRARVSILDAASLHNHHWREQQ